MTELNREIQSWARVLNAPALSGRVKARSIGGAGDWAVRVQPGDGETWIFAMEAAGAPAEAVFELGNGAPAGTTVTEEGSGRRLTLSGREFRDSFSPWQMRIYRISPALR